MRDISWLSLLLIIGCASRPAKEPDARVLLDPQQALENLRAQSEGAGRAAIQEDHAKMAELTLPGLVEQFGGRAEYIKKLESMAADMKGKGYRIKKFNIGTPSSLVQAGGEVYAVIPTELELSGPAGAEVKQPSSLIAVSKDGGAWWRFLNGAGVGGDRSKLKRLLPNFPEQLKSVASEPSVWDHCQFSHSLGPPKTLSRPGFTFEHPSTWTVDDKDKQYDPDHLFTIDASVGAMIMFVIADAELDPAKTLAINVQAQSKRIPNAAQTEFDRWGNFDGRGVVLRGKVVGLVPATVRLFVFNAEGRTVTVIEFCPDDEKKQIAPGFQTIENSFRVLH